MREVGRSRSNTSFEQKAERRLRARRREERQMHDEYWSVRTSLEDLRENDITDPRDF